MCRVVGSSVGCYDRSLLEDISHSLRLKSNHSIEEATNKVFLVSDIYVHALEFRKYLLVLPN